MSVVRKKDNHSSSANGAPVLRLLNSQPVVQKRAIEEGEIGPIKKFQASISNGSNKCKTCFGNQEKSLDGSVVTKVVVPSKPLPVTEQIIARRQRINMIGARLLAKQECLQPASLVFPVSALTAAIPTMVVSAAKKTFVTTSDGSKPKSKGRRRAQRKDLPKIDDRLHKRTSVKKKKMGPELSGESSSETEDTESMEEIECRWGTCREVFTSKKALIQHFLSVHLNGETHKIKRCEWEGCSRKTPFSGYYLLKNHARVHTGEKRFRCSACSKRFIRNEYRVRHQRTHTGEKPYKCGEAKCEKAFGDASDRAKHMKRVHSNARPYECGLEGCTYSYTDPSSLRKHVQTHHGRELYEKMKLNKLSLRRTVEPIRTTDPEMRESLLGTDFEDEENFVDQGNETVPRSKCDASSP